MIADPCRVRTRAQVSGHLNQPLKTRTRAGLSQYAVATCMGTTKGTISRLETGMHSPSLNTLKRFAAAVGFELLAYVDLNSVRAGIADSVEASDFTSGKQRLGEVAASEFGPSEIAKPSLRPFAQVVRQGEDAGLPFNLQDYLDLLDTTGRVVHPKKRGAIPATAPRLRSTLGLEPGEWIKDVAELHARFRLFIGAPHRLSSLAEQRGWRWVRGQSAARRLYQCVAA